MSESKRSKAKNKLFAVPVRAITQDCLNRLKSLSIIPLLRKVHYDSYALNAYIFSAPDEESLTSMHMEVLDGRFTEAFTVTWGNRKIPFHTVNGMVQLVSYEGTDAIIDGPNTETGRYADVRKELMLFSKLTGGLGIIFHEEDRNRIAPPPPDQDGAINIYSWSHPPGNDSFGYVRRVFGMLTSKECDSILTYKGVAGRGEFVGDGTNNLVQLIGNNWYILCCIIEYFTDHTTINILRRLLAASLVRYEELLLNIRPNTTPRPLVRKEFSNLVSGWIGALVTSFSKSIEKKQKRIEQLRCELAMEERIVVDSLIALEGLKDNKKMEGMLAGIPAQWKRIKSNPLVAGLISVDDAIHVTTTRYVLEYEGVKHLLGQYVIRIDSAGTLTIWNLDRLHSEGIPHPHISKEGSPCMGNATSAITSAIANYRIDDAIEYITKWLADGYEHTLARHKIYEWPSEHIEPDGSVTFIQKILVRLN